MTPKDNMMVMGWMINLWIAIVGLCLKFVQLFFTRIDALDAGVTVLVSWLLLYYGANWNGWLALLLGLLVAVVVYIIFKHRIGFWIVSSAYSFGWGLLLVGIVSSLWFPHIQELHFWLWVAAITALAGWSHYSTRNRDWEKKMDTTIRNMQPGDAMHFDPIKKEVRSINVNQ